jgi:hypothetical protein
LITFLVHLYSNSGKNASSTSQSSPDALEAGYSKLTRGSVEEHEDGDGPESYELTEHDLSADEDATKVGGEDEIDWMDRDGTSRVRL